MAQAPVALKITYSIDDLDTVAESLCKAIFRPGIRFCFTGELGAGKTTLIRAIARHLKSPDEVSSPSYTLQHFYSVPLTNEILTIEHWDLFRVSVLPEELSEPVGKGIIQCIEWGEKFPSLMTAAGIFTIKIPDENHRQLEVTLPLDSLIP